MLLDKIKILCDSKDITIPDLEIALGLGAGTISKWRSHEPGAYKLVKIANFFKCTVDELLHDECDLASKGRLITNYRENKKLKSPVRDMDKAYTEKIVVVQALIGEGSNEDPVRSAKLYFTKDGAFIGEIS